MEQYEGMSELEAKEMIQKKFATLFNQAQAIIDNMVRVKATNKEIKKLRSILWYFYFQCLPEVTEEDIEEFINE